MQLSSLSWGARLLRGVAWFRLSCFTLSLLGLGSAALAREASYNLPFVQLSIESIQEGPLGVDQQQRLRVLGELADGRRFAYPGPLRWSEEGPELDVGDNGFVSGLKEGVGTVRVQALDDPRLSASLQLEVKKLPVRVYFKAPQNWQQVNVWYWYLDGDATASGVNDDGTRANAVLTREQGSFPGPVMQPLPGRPGWFSAVLPRFDDERAYPGQKLRAQPLRLLFSNPLSGEKTRDFLHLDGCFIASNRYLNAQIIEGRWESPSDCSVFPKKLRALAEPRGGPVFSEKTPLSSSAEGERAVLTAFTLNGSPALNATSSPVSNLGAVLEGRDWASLCLSAEAQGRGEKSSECFAFQNHLEAPPASLKTMGPHYTPEATTFTLWSPDRKSVELWIDGRTLPMGSIGEAGGKSGVWAITVPGDMKLKRYHFILDDMPVRDPYARMVEPGSDFGIVLDTAAIKPPGGWVSDPPLRQREDAIVYELSVRDFTFSPTSGISAPRRGTFLGLVESGSYLNKDQAGADPSIKTGIDHLKELGVTHVQLMPSFDYATCSAKDIRNSPSCYNWGYDPENYNVPEERYSTRPLDYEYRVREFQTMVNELHKAGIRVIMDVVYNHTWVRPFREADEGERYLGPITSRYFLRSPDGVISDLTGTGNTLDPRDPMVYQYIQDSLAYWVETYNIDGFRFDLAGVFDYGEINGWMRYLHERFPEKQLLAFGEPYTAVSDPDPDHFRLDRISSMRRADGQPTEFGGFNYIFREAIKGSNDTGFGGGFAFNEIVNLSSLINGLRGSLGRGDVWQSAFADDPAQTINYASSHDNLNLYDKIEAWAALQSSPISLDYKKRIQVFTNAVVLLSQGIPFLHYGEEFLRSKNGNPNSYQAGDGINQVDWRRKKQFKDVFDAYAQLVEARRRFSGLRLPSREAIENSLQINSLGRGLIEIRVAGDGRGREELLILLNSGLDREYTLPPGEWTLALAESRAIRERQVRSRIVATGTAATLLYR